MRSTSEKQVKTDEDTYLETYFRGEQAPEQPYRSSRSVKKRRSAARHFPIGRWFQRFLNLLFLLTLGVALIALVLSFAYLLIHDPTTLGVWSSELLARIQALLQPLIAPFFP